MCKMRQTRKGGFRRYGDFCEVQLNGSDTYHEITAKALSTLSGVVDEDEETDCDGANPILLRAQGTIVANQRVEVKPGEYQSWSLENYLLATFNRTSSIKLGVGFTGTEVSLVHVILLVNRTLYYTVGLVVKLQS